VYPTLTMLEEMGYARVDTSEGGTKKASTSSPTKAARFSTRTRHVDALMARMEVTARAAAKYAADRDHEAMRTLKRALIMRGALWSQDEGQARARATSSR